MMRERRRGREILKVLSREIVSVNWEFVVF